MKESVEIEIKKSYATLVALKNNLPKNDNIQEKYVRIFNSEIERLTNLGFNDLKEFKVPESEIKPLLLGWNYITGGDKKYSQERYVDREFLLIKVDSVLGFFSVHSSKEEIGFKI